MSKLLTQSRAVTVVGLAVLAIAALLVTQSLASQSERRPGYEYGELQIGRKIEFETGGQRVTLEINVFSGERKKVIEPGQLGDIHVERENITNKKLLALNHMAKAGWNVVEVMTANRGALGTVYLMRRPHPKGDPSPTESGGNTVHG